MGARIANPNQTKQTRRRTIVVASVAAIATAMSAAPAIAHRTPAASSRHQLGFYVDQTYVGGGIARGFSVTRSGYRHWAGPRAHAYATLAPDAAKARHAHTHYSSYYGARKPSVLLTVSSVNGKRVNVVTLQRRSIQVVQVAQSARRLPTVTKADQAVVTNAGNPGSSYPLGGAVAIAHNRIALFFPNDPRVPTNDGPPVVYVGKPGHPFHRKRLPGATQPCLYYSSAIARDPHNGALDVACTEYDSTTDDGEFQVWKARTSHDPFTGPAGSPLLDRHENLTSLAVTHGDLWATLVGAAPGGSYGDYLIHRIPSSGFTQQKLPHATYRDTEPTLAVDPRPSSRAIWEANLRIKTHHRGDFVFSGTEVRRLGTHITKPTLITHGDDAIYGFAVTWAGKPTLLHEFR